MSFSSLHAELELFSIIMPKITLRAGMTIAFSLMPIGSKFTWMGNDGLFIVKMSDFSAEAYNGNGAWSVIDGHFKTDTLVTFWEI